MKIIKMSVDTFWKGEVRVQGQIEDETKVYQTRMPSIHRRFRLRRRSG